MLRSCQSCHIRDGRGHAPDGPDDSAVSMFLRVSVPAAPGAHMPEITDWIATAPDPVYGGQLQDFATVGHPAEYRLQIDYEEIPVALSGGETASLRRPQYKIYSKGVDTAESRTTRVTRARLQREGRDSRCCQRGKVNMNLRWPEATQSRSLSQ